MEDCSEEEWKDVPSSEKGVEDEESVKREERITGDAVPTIANASVSIELSKVTKEGNCSLLRYVLYGVERKRVGPNELSDAVLDENRMEEKVRVMVDVDVRVDRSRYIPPPLFAEHEEKEEWVTEAVLAETPLTYTAPPFPEDAVHDVNVVLDSSVPVMERERREF